MQKLTDKMERHAGNVTALDFAILHFHFCILQFQLRIVFSQRAHGASKPADYAGPPSSRTSTRRNGSTSVTSPTVWKVPRSASFVTVAGLMSTQTVFTLAGSKLPTAMLCRVVAIIRQKVKPRTRSRILVSATSP